MVTKRWNGLPRWGDVVPGKVGEGGDACVPERYPGAPKMGLIWEGSEPR